MCKIIDDTETLINKIISVIIVNRKILQDIKIK